ncbi:hypothetical protein [Gemmatimonas groenlandica]|uniref:Glycosyltransferase RgtA/B/C/D-like domain-containing protein n=1 Tax=Gemmatimonas groenlandica TaxID=2732249 RepID=A0A6M4ISP6_9BACT|nr:hypothetical protein [Gemmatimonas groenlandica]QJR37763.1 hypothetical protein HKW67_20685 [Gemmatimonas groenlandica]
MKKSQHQTNTGSEFAELSFKPAFGWDIGLCLLVAVCAALLMPLDDADLPMHLATGAWILDHGRLPLTEPFAWTRMGAPFFAYSWLPEVAYEGARRVMGLVGVSVVHAVTVAGAVVAVWDLARAARWSLWATRLMLSVHVILWLLVQPATRPQLVLAIALPMAWAAAYRLRSATSPVAGLVMTLLAAALAVNSHLLFPLTIVPVVVLLGAERFRLSRVAAFVASTVVGWLCTPNALHLLDILRLNLGANALLGAASPIMELEPGFGFLIKAAVGTKLVAGGLLVLPLLPFYARLPQRERWWLGMAWLAGLGLFGLAIRGLLLWWLLAMPVVALALASIPLPTLVSTRRAVVGAWVVAVFAPIGHALKARELLGPVDGLPHPEAKALAPAVRWLTCATAGADSAGGVARGTTVFDDGSYLAWRVPSVSWSVDGRTIFPDSVTRAEAGQQLRYGAVVYPPWRHGDVVLLPATHAVAAVIDADSSWQRIAITPGADAAAAVGVWARRKWMNDRPNGAACVSDGRK